MELCKEQKICVEVCPISLVVLCSVSPRDICFAYIAAFSNEILVSNSTCPATARLWN